jgi:hypothetical protein
MTRLILTTSDSGAGHLKVAGIADIVCAIALELVWGPLPSDEELGNSWALMRRRTMRGPTGLVPSIGRGATPSTRGGSG